MDLLPTTQPPEISYFDEPGELYEPDEPQIPQPEQLLQSVAEAIHQETPTSNSGLKNLSYPSPYYTPEFKMEVVRYSIATKSLIKAQRKYGVSKSAIYKWVQQSKLKDSPQIASFSTGLGPQRRPSMVTPNSRQMPSTSNGMAVTRAPNGVSIATRAQPGSSLKRKLIKRKVKKTPEWHSVEFKKAAVEYGKAKGTKEASTKFNVCESTIRAWTNLDAVGELKETIRPNNGAQNFRKYPQELIDAFEVVYQQFKDKQEYITSRWAIRIPLPIREKLAKQFNMTVKKVHKWFANRHANEQSTKIRRQQKILEERRRISEAGVVLPPKLTLDEVVQPDAFTRPLIKQELIDFLDTYDVPSTSSKVSLPDDQLSRFSTTSANENGSNSNGPTTSNGHAARTMNIGTYAATNNGNYVEPKVEAKSEGYDFKYIIYAPNYEEDQFKIEVENGFVIVQAERYIQTVAAETKDTLWRKIYIPDDIDASTIEANFNDVDQLVITGSKKKGKRVLSIGRRSGF